MAFPEKMRLFGQKSSWIRKMFEEGARMKAEYGAESVCDFSLGNPDLPPPPSFTEVICRELAGRRQARRPCLYGQRRLSLGPGGDCAQDVRRTGGQTWSRPTCS